VKHKQIVIAADDGLGASRESELQLLVVLWISAVGYLHRRLEPDGRMPQDFEDALTPRERNRECKLGAAQNSGDLGVHLGRQSEHVDFFGT
jgi:hypothetical protein